MLLEPSRDRKSRYSVSRSILADFGRPRDAQNGAKLAQDGAKLDPRWPPRWSINLSKSIKNRCQNGFFFERILNASWNGFWKPNRRKIIPRMVSKTRRNRSWSKTKENQKNETPLSVFQSFLNQLGSKIHAKSMKNRTQKWKVFRSGFWTDFGSILGGFWTHLGSQDAARIDKKDIGRLLKKW